jgi:glucose uptake protein
LIVVSDARLAILLCVLTMLGWGSWANTQKASDRDAWPFPLFYWDYTIGVFLFALVAWFGMQLSDESTLTTFRLVNNISIIHGFISGVLFNIANLLLVVAIDAAGMAVAFPLGIGLALIIGTVISYIESPRGNPVLIALGVLLILAAMLLSAAAHRRSDLGRTSKGAGGPIFAIVAGCLMGLFYPQLALAISPEVQAGHLSSHNLPPLAALLTFSIGVLVSNAVINTILMRTQGIQYSHFFGGRVGTHVWGLLGGAIWMFALACNLFASSAAGPAISYALGQGATLVAALWGIFVWKEFRSAPEGTVRLVALMLGCYATGLVLIGAATFS